MSEELHSYTCRVALQDDSTPYEWKGESRSAIRAAEHAAESMVYEYDESEQEVGVKVIDDATGDVSFFDVEIEIHVHTSATAVRGEELARRVAEHAAEHGGQT